MTYNKIKHKKRLRANVVKKTKKLNMGRSKYADSETATDSTYTKNTQHRIRLPQIVRHITPHVYVSVSVPNLI